MELRVLGPVEAFDDGEVVALGGSRPRTLVAALALGGEVISPGRLMEELWRSDPPPTATGTLQSYLSRLRAALGADRLVKRPGGYILLVEGAELDVRSFEEQIAQARLARDAGEAGRAVTAYDAALACWRGEVADGLDHGPILREAAARLIEQRMLTLEERIEVQLTAGNHHDVVAELEGLTAAHPHRERLHAQRLIALYRAGRQGEALEAYQQARTQLVAGLGIEPGPQLRELQQRVLDQDPALGVNADVVPAAAVVVAGSPRSADLPVDADRRPPGNLPTPLGSFVGRIGSRRRIAASLAGDARLITLVGAGGCGKTQLALRAAADVSDRYIDGVWWVELSSHRDPALVARAVADAVGLPAGQASDAVARIADRFGEGRHLLVIDNCEHLIGACAELAAELLRRSARLRIMATSREPLDIDGERIWRVPSLDLPPADASPSEILDSEAARLLLVRAQAVRPELTFTEGDAPTVARVCRELDGIPLALELAAARLNVLSLGELADRLGDRFRVLAHGRRSAPARHRTLEAAIGWSYDLLSRTERVLLTRLSVFSGGFTVTDAEAVCSGDGLAAGQVVEVLAALLDKSLVQRSTEPGGRARHDLLATVRSFARTRLEGPATDRLAVRHAEHYAGLAEEAAPELIGPGQVQWLNRLHAEQDNFRVVLDRGGQAAVRVAGSVWWFWLQFGHAVEGDRWMQELLRQPTDQDGATRLELHRGAARLAAAVGDPGRASQHLAAAIRVGRQLDHTGQLAQDHAFAARLAAAEGDHRAAATQLAAARACAQAAQQGWYRAMVEHHAAVVAWHDRDLAVAATAAAAAERGFRDVGDEWSACLARLGAARVARERGDSGLAVALHRTNLERGLDLTVSSLDFVGLPQDLQDLALIAVEAGDHALAVTLVGVAATLRTAVELPGSTAAAHDQLLDRAGSMLDAQTFEQAYDDGRVGSAERAIALALDRTVQLAG